MQPDRLLYSGRVNNFMDTVDTVHRIDMESDSDIYVMNNATIGCGLDINNDGIGDEFCNGILIRQTDGGISYIDNAKLAGFTELLHRNGDGDVHISQSSFWNFSAYGLTVDDNDNFSTFEILSNRFKDDQQQVDNIQSIMCIRDCDLVMIDVDVIGNVMSDDGAGGVSTGIYLADNTVENIVLRNNLIWPALDYGIFVSNSSYPENGNVSLDSNLVNGSSMGVVINPKYYATLHNNFVWNCNWGVVVYQSEGVEISGIRDWTAELLDSVIGIGVVESSDITITDVEFGRLYQNIFSDPYSIGILVQDSEDVSIEGFVGVLGQLGAKGVSVVDSPDTEVKYSRIQGFTDVGIELLSTDPTQRTDYFNIYGNELISRDAGNDIVADSIGIWVRPDKTGNDTYTKSLFQ